MPPATDRPLNPFETWDLEIAMQGRVLRLTALAPGQDRKQARWNQPFEGGALAMA